MKKIIKTIVLFLTISSCKAQSNVINITDWCNNQTSETNGSLYLKDINNLYAPYIGTWKWTQSNREFTLTLIKQTKFHYNEGNDNFYRDRIVGYYVYKENGVELINTINDNLNDDYGVKVYFNLDCYSDFVGKIKDVLKNKVYRSWFEVISPTQIKFHGKDDTHIRSQKEGQPPLQPQFVGTTFPLEMVLTKQ